MTSAAFDYAQDFDRLKKIGDRVAKLMRDGKWRTHAEVAEACKCSQTGASARLREFTQEGFEHYGVIKVLRRPRSGHLNEYKCVYGNAVTADHLNAVKQFVRGEGPGGINRGMLISQLHVQARAQSKLETASATWNAAINQLASEGVLSCEGERVAYVIPDGNKTAEDPQQLLF